MMGTVFESSSLVEVEVEALVVLEAVVTVGVDEGQHVVRPLDALNTACSLPAYRPRVPGRTSKTICERPATYALQTPLKMDLVLWNF